MTGINETTLVNINPSILPDAEKFVEKTGV